MNVPYESLCLLYGFLCRCLEAVGCIILDITQIVKKIIMKVVLLWNMNSFVDVVITHKLDSYTIT